MWELRSESTLPGCLIFFESSLRIRPIPEEEKGPGSAQDYYRYPRKKNFAAPPQRLMFQPDQDFARMEQQLLEEEELLLELPWVNHPSAYW